MDMYGPFPDKLVGQEHAPGTVKTAAWVCSHPSRKLLKGCLKGQNAKQGKYTYYRMELQ
jgi:hypothetical protein